MRHNGSPFRKYRLQPLASLNQANPVSGTKYTVLDRIHDIRLMGISGAVTWTVQPSPFEVHLEIDGRTVRIYQNNPVTATIYYAVLWSRHALNAQLMSATNYQAYNQRLIDCESLLIQAETTGGTVQSLDVDVMYARKE